MAFFNSLLGQWHAFLISLVLFGHVLASIATGHPNLQPAPLAATSTPLLATSTLQTAPAPVIVATSSAPKAATSTPKTASASLAPAASTTAQTIPVPIATTMSPEQVNDVARAALVNILCTTQTGGSFEPLSGSGVIIDTRGVILTNAHVGQYFLVRNYGAPGNIQCVVRQGSPAQALYTAQLIYLPPAWIAANAGQINAQIKTGTGENDYAFLLITGTTNPGASLPATFPALPMTVDSPSVGEAMLLAAYPAGFLGGETIQMNLNVTSALTTVQDLYTFDDPHNIDAVGVGGTVVSQSGSSGGAVVRLADGSLNGIISTDTEGTTTASRQLNAITLAHINRSLASEGQGGMVQLLSQQNLQQTAANFASTTGATETQELEAVLNKQ